MTPRAKKTQAERRNDSEQALLKAATDVTANAGVASVTFESVGKIGGFSRGLASVRFGSKSKLIEAVLRNLDKHREEVVAARGFDDLPGLDAVLQYVDLSLREVADQKEARAYFMLLASSVAEVSELRAVFAATHTEGSKRIGSWIARGQAEGTIRPDLAADETGLIVGCLVLGLSMQSLVDPTTAFARLREASLSMLRTTLSVSPHDAVHL